MERLIMSDKKERFKLIKEHGFRFLRKAKGTHEIWINDKGQTILISKNGSTGYKGIHNLKAQLKRLKASSCTVTDSKN